MPYEEGTKAREGGSQANYYQEALEESKAFREGYKKRKGVIKSHEMPWENAPQGRIKHVINEKMDTTECALQRTPQW
jgi:hypothetical protein